MPHSNIEMIGKGAVSCDLLSRWSRDGSRSYQIMACWPATKECKIGLPARQCPFSFVIHEVFLLLTCHSSSTQTDHFVFHRFQHQHDFLWSWLHTLGAPFPSSASCSAGLPSPVSSQYLSLSLYLSLLLSFIHNSLSCLMWAPARTLGQMQTVC